MISLTERAATEIKAVMEQNNATDAYLRVAVAGHGCHGMNYQLGLDPEVSEPDSVYESFGVKIAIDGISLSMMEGSTIAYMESEDGAGFSIENPNDVPEEGCSGGCAGCGGH